MLREAKNLWILRFRVGGTTCSEILGSAQNDNPTNFVRNISVILGC